MYSKKKSNWNDHKTFFFWPGDLDLWPMTLVYDLDLDILLTAPPAKIQVCMFVHSARRVRWKDRRTHTHTVDAETITPITSETWGVKIIKKSLCHTNRRNCGLHAHSNPPIFILGWQRIRTSEHLAWRNQNVMCKTSRQYSTPLMKKKIEQWFLFHTSIHGVLAWIEQW